MSGMLVQTLTTIARAPDEAELLARATRMAGIGAWRCDLADNRLAWTEGVYDLFGVDRDAAIDRRDIVTLYDEESRDTLERVRSDAIARRSRFSLEARIVRPDGEARWIRITADYARTGDRCAELYGLKQDITADRVRWDALRRLADCDALTGLASRGTFQRDFLDRCSAPGALALFDVDGFKQINDRFGHAAGDACLVAVAHRLRAAFAGAAMVARIGGDEFAVVLPGKPASVAHRIEQLLEDITAPIAWRGQLLMLSASAGVALPPDGARFDAEALFVAADDALYAAKRGGRNRMAFAPCEQASVRRYAGSIR